MGFLSRLFSKAQPVLYPGDETLEVVGESYRQDTLWRLVGGYTTEHVRRQIRAQLIHEPTNPRDSNAVMVQIGGQCVGYLASEDAAAYLPGLKRLSERGPVELEGMIVGGGERERGMGALGVFLDHDPRHFGIPRTGHTFGETRLRTGFSEAVASDFEDNSYDLSWHAGLSDDHATAAQQLRSLLRAESDPIDRHFMMAELTKRLYKCRETDEPALAQFDVACEEHHAQIVTIRSVLLDKFGVVPVIETYRQAVIRCQKAKEWTRMREWAERGVSFYGNDAARPEVVEDLHKRLAYAMAKIERDSNPKRRRQSRPPTAAAVPIIESLVCTRCGSSFERQRMRGRKPHLCPDCRGIST